MRVVQRGVDRLLHRGRSVKFHATKLRTPQLLRRRSHSVKVEARHLGIHVGDCVLFAYRRKRDLHNQRFGRGRKTEDSLQAATFYALRILRRVARRLEATVRRWILFAVIKRMPRHRRRKANREIKLAAGSPASRLSHSGHRAIFADAHTRPQHFAWIVVDAAAQVQQKMTLGVRSKCVAMHAHAFARRQLRSYVRVIQRDGVVARLGMFVLMGKAVSDIRPGYPPDRPAPVAHCRR